MSRCRPIAALRDPVGVVAERGPEPGGVERDIERDAEVGVVGHQRARLTQDAGRAARISTRATVFPSKFGEGVSKGRSGLGLFLAAVAR